MEQNAPGIAKKIWHMVRVAFFMLKKGICKRKILLDLNMMMKRGKIGAGKAIHNLMFQHHNHHNRDSSATDLQYAATAAANPEEYEFSCSNTPIHRRYLNKIKKSSHHDHQRNDLEVANKVLEMMMMSSSSSDDVVAASPTLPGLGFGRSPMARQLRITDSPYPLQNGPEEDSRVDEAAQDFINKFYSQLKQQN